ncbi:MAG: type II toxin-antitoxin system Y4mF family antitoxin [Acidimicrobiia bacterium]
MGAIGYNEVLGNAIRERRRSLGVDQETLASIAGVSRKLVSEIERGKPTVRLDGLIRVLEALGLRLEIL